MTHKTYHKPLLALSLLVLLGLLLASAMIFFRLRDDKVLLAFTASYKKFDTAMERMENGEASQKPDLERSTGQALTELQTNANGLLQLSSATKHDGELMTQARVIAMLSKSDFDVLRAGSSSSTPRARMDAYARFQTLLDD